MLVLSSVIPVVNSSQSVYTVNETDAATFECIATGIPSPTLNWLMEGDRLNATESVIIANASSQLITSVLFQVTQNVIILNATSADAGMYSCRAENAVGNNMATFELRVRCECLEGVTCTSCRH